MKKTLFVFITPTSSQPRFHKRIAGFTNLSDIIIFSFRRGLYEVNNFKDGLQVHDLGRINNRNYIQRIFPIYSAIRILRNKIPRNYKNVKFYAFSIDCLFIAKMAGLKDGFLEVGDLVLMNTSHKWLSFIEKLVLRAINGLVLTSVEYYNQYYKHLGNNHITSFHFIENKIPKVLSTQRVRDKKKVAGKVTIGLIGFLRYELPILRLIKFVENNSSLVTLKVFGDGQFKHYFDQNQSKNINYYGSFKNPDELNEIYKKIDINYVVYDPSSLNVRLALPNKLYESAFFRVPIICSTNTYLSKLVKEWDIGDEIDISSQINFDRDIYKYLKPDWIQSKSNNCLRIPNKSLIDDQEKELKTIIMGKNKKHETSVSKF